MQFQNTLSVRAAVDSVALNAVLHQLEDVRQERDVAEERVRELTMMLDSGDRHRGATQEIAEIHREYEGALATLKQQVASLTALNSTRQLEIDSLSQLVRKYEAEKLRMDDTSHRAADLAGKSDALREENAELKGQNTELKGQNAELRAKAADLESQVRALQQQALASAAAAAQQHRSSTNVPQNQLIHRSTSSHPIRTPSGSPAEAQPASKPLTSVVTVSAQQQENPFKATAVSLLKENATVLEGTIANLREKVQQLERDLEAERTRAAAAEKRRREAQEEAFELQHGMKQEIVVLTGANRTLEAAGLQQRSDIEALDARIARITEKLRQAEEAADGAANMSRRVEGFDEIEKSLKQKLKHMAEIHAMDEAECDRLRASLKEKDRELSDLRDTLASDMSAAQRSADETLRKKDEELSRMAYKLRVLRSDAEETESELAGLRGRLRAKASETEEADAERQKAAEEAKRHHAALLEAEAGLQGAQMGHRKQLAEAAAAAEEARRLLHQEEARSRSLGAELAEEQARARELEAQVAAAAAAAARQPPNPPPLISQQHSTRQGVSRRDSGVSVSTSSKGEKRFPPVSPSPPQSPTDHADELRVLRLELEAAKAGCLTGQVDLERLQGGLRSKERTIRLLEEEGAELRQRYDAVSAEMRHMQEEVRGLTSELDAASAALRLSESRAEDSHRFAASLQKEAQALADDLKEARQEAHDLKRSLRSPHPATPDPEGGSAATTEPLRQQQQQQQGCSPSTPPSGGRSRRASGGGGVPQHQQQQAAPATPPRAGGPVTTEERLQQQESRLEALDEELRRWKAKAEARPDAAEQRGDAPPPAVVPPAGGGSPSDGERRSSGRRSVSNGTRYRDEIDELVREKDALLAQLMVARNGGKPLHRLEPRVQTPARGEGEGGSAEAPPPPSAPICVGAHFRTDKSARNKGGWHTHFLTVADVSASHDRVTFMQLPTTAFSTGDVARLVASRRLVFLGVLQQPDLAYWQANWPGEEMRAAAACRESAGSHLAAQRPGGRAVTPSGSAAAPSVAVTSRTVSPTRRAVLGSWLG